MVKSGGLEVHVLDCVCNKLKSLKVAKSDEILLQFLIEAILLGVLIYDGQTDEQTNG